MITVISSPSQLSLSLDPIVYDLESDNFLQSAGLEAINYVSFTSAVTAETQIPLKWNGSVQTFAAKTSPTGSGAQFPAGNGSASYVQSLVPYFQSNVFLSDDFVVSYAMVGSEHSLVFTSKKKGKKYNFSKLDWTSGKIGWIQEAADRTRALNHCLLVRIFLRNTTGNAYDMVFSENLPTDEAGRVSIDVAEILHPYLCLTPELPAWAGMVYQQSKRSIRGYYLQVADGFGSPVQLGQMTTLPTRYVAFGGSGYGRLSLVPSRFFASGKYKALRLGELTRIIIKDAPQWLTFLNQSTVQVDVLLKMKVYFDDNTNEIYNRFIMTWGAWEKLLVEAGPVQCGVFELNNGKTPIAYELFLQKGATVISDTYRYILNDNTYQYRKYFTYVNSLGAVDTLTVWGAQDGQTSLSFATVSKNLPFPYSIGDTEEFQYDAQFHQSYKCFFELDSKSHFNIFRDFLISAYRYRFVAGAAYPIGILSQKWDEPAEDDTLCFGDFEYKFLFTEDGQL
ncbi:hypothetical protein [Runella limosa]|uniref:hypothetical protein n=1 Tax=Runella limosa TaxID=370978 RepID=UPI00048D55A0|nr:hypothetical protein [Runella limosa]